MTHPQPCNVSNTSNDVLRPLQAKHTEWPVCAFRLSPVVLNAGLMTPRPRTPNTCTPCQCILTNACVTSPRQHPSHPSTSSLVHCHHSPLPVAHPTQASASPHTPGSLQTQSPSSVSVTPRAPSAGSGSQMSWAAPSPLAQAA